MSTRTVNSVTLDITAELTELSTKAKLYLHLSVNHASQRHVKHSPGQHHLTCLLLPPHPQRPVDHTGHPLLRWGQHGCIGVFRLAREAQTDSMSQKEHPI